MSDCVCSYDYVATLAENALTAEPPFYAEDFLVKTERIVGVALMALSFFAISPLFTAGNALIGLTLIQQAVGDSPLVSK